MATGRSTCSFSGNVQGVGFRYTTMSIAQRYDVVGYVRNLSDGRVELVIEGSESYRMDLISEIKQHMNGFISEANIVESAATGEFSRFSIRH